MPRSSSIAPAFLSAVALASGLACGATLNTAFTTTGMADNSCNSPAPKTTFAVTDPAVYLFISVAGGQPGDVLSTKWFRPDGVYYDGGSYDPLTAAGNFCFNDGIYLANYPAAQYPGTWTVQGFWNGNPLFSGTFAVTAGSSGGCTYSLSPTSASFPAQGGNGTVTVNAASGCTWKSTSNVDWITIGVGATGAGTQTVGYLVGANPTSTTRTGTMTIAGVTFTVTVAASTSNCTYTLTPSSATVGPGSSSGSIQITTGTGCGWSVSQNDVWVVPQSDTHGTGSGTFAYGVLENPNTSTRTITLTIGSATFVITQLGSCTYTLSATSANVPAAGGGGSVQLTTSNGCAWTISASASWISITSDGHGSGNTTVNYTVSANTASSSRTGTLTIAGQTYTITQAAAAAACTYTLNATSATVPAAGGTGSAQVNAATGCSWTAASNASWITISSGGSGTGNGTVNYSAVANTATASRTGTITIAGQTFTLTQDAAASGPVISDGGVVNNADYTATFSPGMIVAIFGTNLAPSLVSAPGAPLPTALNGTSVEIIDGSTTLKAPLYFVSAGQVNAQLPYEISNSTVQLQVRTASGISPAVTLQVTSSAPRILTQDSSGQGDAMLLHADYSLVNAQNPAVPGEVLILYLTGMGAVKPSLASGAAAGDGGAQGPLNQVSSTVTVTIDYQNADILFAGLAPGFVGLYQINLRTPQTALGGGPSVLTVTVGNNASQNQISMQVGFTWAQLASQTIGPSGGLLNTAAVTVAIAPEAIYPATLAISKATAGASTDPNRVGDVYYLTGIPTGRTQPIGVVFPDDGKSDPSGDFVVLQNSDRSYTFLPVQRTAQGLAAQIPPPAASTASSTAARGSPARTLPLPLGRVTLSPAATPPVNAEDLLFYLIIGYGLKTTAGGAVQLIYPSNSTNDSLANDVLRAVDYALSIVKAGGIDWTATVNLKSQLQIEMGYFKWPSTEVWVGGGQTVKDQLYSYQYLSGLSYPSGVNLKSTQEIQLDLNYLKQPAPGLLSTLGLVPPDGLRLGSRVANVLYYLFLQKQGGLDIVPDRLRWMWMDSLVAAWLEMETLEQMLNGSGHYISPEVFESLQNQFRFPFESELDAGRLEVNGSYPFTKSVLPKGLGSAAFLRHMKVISAASFASNWLSSLAAGSSGSPFGNSQPLSAAETASDWWSYCNAWAQGRIVPNIYTSGAPQPLQDHVLSEINFAIVNNVMSLRQGPFPQRGSFYVTTYPLQLWAGKLVPPNPVNQGMQLTFDVPSNPMDGAFLLGVGSDGRLLPQTFVFPWTGHPLDLFAHRDVDHYLVFVPDGRVLWGLQRGDNSVFSVLSATITAGSSKLDLLALLKTATKVDLEVQVHGQCSDTTSSNPPKDCYIGESIMNTDPHSSTNPNPLLINWTGNSFTVDGDFGQGTSDATHIHITATINLDPVYPEESTISGTATRTEDAGGNRDELGYTFQNVKFNGIPDPNGSIWSFEAPLDQVQDDLGNSFYWRWSKISPPTLYQQLVPGSYSYTNPFYFFFEQQ